MAGSRFVVLPLKDERHVMVNVAHILRVGEDTQGVYVVHRIGKSMEWYRVSALFSDIARVFNAEYVHRYEEDNNA